MVFASFLIFIFLSSCKDQHAEKPPENKWIKIFPLTEPRNGATAVISGDYIYVIGGLNSAGYLKSVERAKIRENGDLEPWTYVGPLPSNRGWGASIVTRGFIYVAGGTNEENGEAILGDVLNGTLERWVKEKNGMTTPRRGFALVEANGYLYVIGGYNGNLLKTVERAMIAQDGSLGQWVPATPMKMERYLLSAAAYRGHIYALGGHFLDGTATNTVERAEIKKDGSLGEWLPVSSMLNPKFTASAVIVGDSIYVLGGVEGGSILKTSERAPIRPDGTLGPWHEEKEQLTKPRSGMGVAFTNDRIYLIGGASFDKLFDDGEWAMITRSGEIRPFLPIPHTARQRYGSSALAAKGNIYVIGGFDGSALSTVEKARINKDGSPGDWEVEKASLNTKRGWGAAVAAGGFLYMIGGFDGEVLRSVERAPLSSDGTLGSWSYTSPLTTPRRGLTALAIGDYIYTFGGFDGERFLDTIERARITPGGGLGEWRLLDQKMSIERYSHAGAATGGFIYMLGGYHGEELFDSVEFARIKPNGDISPWSLVAPMNQARYIHGAFFANGYLYTIGGSRGSQVSGNIERTNITAKGDLGEWSVVASLFPPRLGAQAVVAKGNLYVLGGYNKGTNLSLVERRPIK